MRGLLGWLGLGAAFAVAVACGTEDAGSEPPLTATSKPVATSTGAAPPETDAAVSTPVAAVTDGGTATTYVGTLAATPPVKFGGAPYCNYTVVMKNIDIEVSIVPGGEIIGATVKNTMVEATDATCTFPPSDPSDQTFAFTTLTQLPTGYELAFSGAAANHPATTLTLDIAPSGTGYTATPHWHRTDQDNILNWTVSTTITLGPQ